MRLTVFGSKLSYFTGKFETYLRYKELPYEFRALTMRHYLWTVPRALGATQYPTVRLPDGRWMSDTTPMIAWLESRHPRGPVLPADPVARFVALLIEDYADEWLWRPAMCIRWSHPEDRYVASRELAAEILRLPLPLALRSRYMAHRQTLLFVTHDGIDARTRPHAEAAYTRLLACLEPVLSQRPFLFGERPTVADLGLMGSMWRHFVHDPTPARIMQDTAPAAFAWCARMWNARASRIGERPLLDGVPDDLGPLLGEIGETHLPALAQNAAAHGAAARTHDLTIQDVTYRRVPTSAYRVWCLEQLHRRFGELCAAQRTAVREVLERQGAWAPLWAVEPVASGHDPDDEAPFCRVHRMVRDELGPLDRLRRASA